MWLLQGKEMCKCGYYSLAVIREEQKYDDPLFALLLTSARQTTPYVKRPCGRLLVYDDVNRVP